MDAMASAVSDPWLASCGGLLVSALALRAPLFAAGRRSTQSGRGPTPAAAALRLSYLTVFLFVKFADWLQGPYFYAVYSSKVDASGQAFSRATVSAIFLTGFVATMLVGAVAGGVADAWGRKRACELCTVLYAASFLTTKSDSMPVIYAGRLCGGVGSALLHSAFDAWVCAEFRGVGGSDADRGRWRDALFSLQYFLDGLVAVGAGLIAQAVVSRYDAHAVFDLATVSMVVACGLIAALWAENKGSSISNPLANMSGAASAIVSDVRVLATGAVHAAFGGAMYTFVMVWVPIMDAAAAADGSPPVPHGVVFASFMVCCMIGSSLFGLLVSRGVAASTVMAGILAVAATATGATFCTTNLNALFVAFLVFEGCCGCYFPCMGSIRAVTLPGDLQTSIVTLFGIPLNAFVVGILLNIEAIGDARAMALSSAMLLAALAAHLAASRLAATRLAAKPEPSSTAPDKESKKGK